MPVNTAEYYAVDSLVDPYAAHETLSHRFFSFAGHLFGRIFKALFKRDKKNSQAEDVQTEGEYGNDENAKEEQERNNSENE